MDQLNQRKRKRERETERQREREKQREKQRETEREEKSYIRETGLGLYSGQWSLGHYWK